jgi:hypothetical protein
MSIRPPHPKASLPNPAIAQPAYEMTGVWLWREVHRRLANQPRDRAPMRPRGMRERPDRDAAANVHAAHRHHVGLVTAEIRRLKRQRRPSPTTPGDQQTPA